MSDNDDRSSMQPAKPEQLVGRTLADLVIHSKTGPKLDAALARLFGCGEAILEAGWLRVTRLFGRVDQKLEEANISPQAIPERVGLEVIKNVSQEDREELHELWANLLVASARGLGVDAFHIDLVRRLDSPSAQLLDTVVRAWVIAEKQYPVRRGPEAFGRGLEEHLTAQVRHGEVAEFMSKGPPSDDLRPAAAARLLALGLVADTVPFIRPTPVGLEIVTLAIGGSNLIS